MHHDLTVQCRVVGEVEEPDGHREAGQRRLWRSDGTRSGTIPLPATLEDGEPIIAARMKMTMSCDHRVIDGATGARFLQTLKGFLEEPAMVLA